MQNINPVILEYGMLWTSLVAVTVLAAIGKLDMQIALPVITAIIAYSVNGAKGAVAVGTIQTITSALPSPNK